MFDSTFFAASYMASSYWSGIGGGVGGTAPTTIVTIITDPDSGLEFGGCRINDDPNV